MTRVRRTGRSLLVCAITTFALLAPQAGHASAHARGEADGSLYRAGSGRGATPPARARLVAFNGVRVTVPALWPVIDLRLHPRTCVRLDRPAVYLGSAGSQPNCPAHAVGRADTIWLRTTDTGAKYAMTLPAVRVGGLAARAGTNPVNHEKYAQFVSQGVELAATWGADSASVDQVLASVAGSSVPSTPLPKPSSPATTSATSPSTAATKPAPLRTGTSPTGSLPAGSSGLVGGSTFTGMAFDACAAPSLSTMTAWLGSPYRTVGVYIGGAMRACADGNLSASWVTQVQSKGWGLLPIYVGLQAPCVSQPGLSKIPASQAAASGRAAAADAVVRAKFFGLAPGAPLYFDMEAYNTSVAGCSQTVLTFMSAWTSELHRLGYKSGAYGSSASLMVDMSRASASTAFAAPDHVWFAHWNGLQTTTDASSYPGFPNTRWSAHQRVHQYSGSLSQSWGGVSLNIDANWVDAGVAGTAVPVSYGTNVMGPGSKGFVFTGSMAYWRSGAPDGLRRMSYWTRSSGSTEGNGATWAPLLAPGLYDVQANIPATGATAKAPYTIRDALGTTTRVVNQLSLKGYTSLGTYTVRSGNPLSVHVGDNDSTSTSTQVGVDAMAFRLVASGPGAPGSVSAIGGDGQATVSWGAAAANGSPVTAYTVRATPGGATASVSGSTRSWVMTGLTNGTAYTFTVTAANAAGTGAASAASAAVAPSSGALPTAPPGVVAAPANAQATVFWTAPARNGGSAITGYAVRVVNAATSGQVGALRPSAATSLIITGLVNGTRYAFQVRATNAAGPSPYSALSNPVTPIVTAAVTRLSDFTRDGLTDLVARDAAGVLWLYPGNGAGGLLSRRRMGSGWNSMTAIINPGDVTGDRDADVIARDAAGALWLYPGRGGGALGARRKIGSGWRGFTISAAANLNGSGWPDLLARDAAGTLWLYPLSGNAVFGRRSRLATGWGAKTSILGPGDLSGDGKADVLARDAAGSLWLYRGNGAGVLGAAREVVNGWAAGAIGQQMSALVAHGNRDRAGGNDLIARSPTGVLRLYPGDSAGGFSPTRVIGTGFQSMTYLG